MPQLHNETPSAQNKRLKAELANERATVADLEDALRGLLRPSDPLNPIEYAPLVAQAKAALAKANGKGL